MKWEYQSALKLYFGDNGKSKTNCDEFLMDGNTDLWNKYLQHKIKADASVKEVSAASILAKVSRDRYMDEISA